MSVGGRGLLYLSLWRHLLLRGRERLQLLGFGFRRDVLVFVRVLQAVLGEVRHLRNKEGEESNTPENHTNRSDSIIFI